MKFIFNFKGILCLFLLLVTVIFLSVSKITSDSVRSEQPEIIPVVFNVNDKYVKYLSVAMASILINTDKNLHFYILNDGISKENKQKLQKLRNIRPFDITFIEPDQEKLSHLPLGSLSPSSFVTNLRLLISYIKPGMDKCILLDADLVFFVDIAKLWQVDVTDYYMAAVIDPIAKVKQRFWIKDLPLPDKYYYVNTGMCVVNLKKWREDDVEKKFFINASLYADKLEFPDQDILNITLYPHIKYLEPQYNAMPPDKYFDIQQRNQAYKGPVLLHWVGPKKPWQHNVRAFQEKVFWYRAKFSPFYEELKAEKGL